MCSAPCAGLQDHPSFGVLVVTLAFFAAIQNPVQELLDGIHSEQVELFENIAYSFLTLLCRATMSRSFFLQQEVDQASGMPIRQDLYDPITVSNSDSERPRTEGFKAHL